MAQHIKRRNLKAINIEAFKGDIKNSEMIRYPKTNATGLAQQYVNWCPPQSHRSACPISYQKDLPEAS